MESPGYRSWRSQTRRSRVQRVATISPVAIANPAPGDNAARKTGRGGARQSTPEPGAAGRHHQPRGDRKPRAWRQC
ncbi:hypothetical protein TMBG_02147, partial [Mycobacterium tuberculosis SUMu002]